MSAQTSEIINTNNLFINDTNLRHVNNFKIQFKNLEDSHWNKVTNDELGEHLIASFDLAWFDYSLFDLIKKYEEYIPIDKQEYFEKNFLFKSEGISPEILFDFLKYMYKYSKTDFVKDEYYYTIYNLTSHYNSGSPIRIKIDNKTYKISTIHSTYKNKSEHMNQYELTDESVRNGVTKWIDIIDGEIIEGDTEKLFIKKFYYKDKFDELFMNLFKLCELASSLDLQIERNASW